MSAAMIPLAIEALTEIIPLVQTLLAQAKGSDTPPTAQQEADINAALDKAAAAIDAA